MILVKPAVNLLTIVHTSYRLSNIIDGKQKLDVSYGDYTILTYFMSPAPTTCII